MIEMIEYNFANVSRTIIKHCSEKLRRGQLKNLTKALIAHDRYLDKVHANPRQMNLDFS